MASSISAKHGVLGSKASLFHAFHRKMSPSSVCVPRAAEVRNVRAASGATADPQFNEKYCLELVRWVGLRLAALASRRAAVTEPEGTFDVTSIFVQVEQNHRRSS